MYSKIDQLTSLKAFVVLQRAAASVSQRAHEHLLEDQLTYSQFAVMEAIFHLGPQTQGTLGKKILKSNANLTTVVDSLEKKGLAKRSRSSADRRQVRVLLTDAGEELIRKVFPRHAAGIAEILAPLSLEDCNELIRLLKKVGIGGTEKTMSDLNQEEN